MCAALSFAAVKTSVAKGFPRHAATSGSRFMPNKETADHLEPNKNPSE